MLIHLTLVLMNIKCILNSGIDVYKCSLLCSVSTNWEKTKKKLLIKIIFFVENLGSVFFY